MAYRIEGKDIIIDGFENGIADSPHLGIADMRNINISTVPKEAPVNFKMRAMTLPPAVDVQAFTVDASTNTFTWTPGTLTLYKGAAVQLNTNTSTGVTTGVVYFVGNISGSTFKLYTALNGTNGAMLELNPIDITVSGSGTFSTFQLAKPTQSCLDYRYTYNVVSSDGPYLGASYMVDSKNQVWLLVPYNVSTSISNNFPAGCLVYCGNIGSSSSTGTNSICIGFGYLFLFRNSATDIFTLDFSEPPATEWIYDWGPINPTSPVSMNSIFAQDNAIYICDGNKIASIIEVAGENFDPTDSTTYTDNDEALRLPDDESATCIVELGTNLLIGGIKNKVYPWDRISTSYNYPLILPEDYTGSMVSSNSNAYIFAGKTGQIYITNGSNVDPWKKIPDSLTTKTNPYFRFGGRGFVQSTTSAGVNPNGDAKYCNNALYFSFTDVDNAGTSLNNLTGLWKIDLTTDSLALVNKLTHDTYLGKLSVIIQNISNFTPGGEGMFCGWTDTNGVPGIDVSDSVPYSNYEAYIETDIIEVGTYLDPFTPSQIEWKMAAPLGNNGTSESIRISYRSDLVENYTVIGTTTISTPSTSSQENVSGLYKTNFQKIQWIQLKIEMSSNATTPTFCRLTEVRVRDWPSGKNSK